MTRQRIPSRANSFDHHSPAIAERIHEEYAAIRSEAPVAWSEEHGGFWLVTGWKAQQDLARNHRALSSRVGLIPNTLGDHVLIPISMDPPEHSTYRSLLLRWFTPRRVATFEPLIRNRAKELIQRLSETADLATDYAEPLPLDVILAVIGVPDREMGPVPDGVRATIHGGEDPFAALGAIEAAYTYLGGELVPELRRSPGDDLISFLVGSEIDGEPLSDETIASIAFNIVGAGFDTTYKTLSSSLAYLAGNPDDQKVVRSSADIPRVVEELLRMFAPVSVGRVMTEDLEYAGADMRAGDAVLLAFPAAGRDPEVFPNPDHADFDRQPNQHLSFGSGIHRCLGMHLARLELAIALEELLAATSWFELVPGQPPAYNSSQVWGATTVPARLTR